MCFATTHRCGRDCRALGNAMQTFVRLMVAKQRTGWERTDWNTETLVVIWSQQLRGFCRIA